MTPRTRLESFRSRQQPSTAAEHTRASGFQLKLPGKPLVPKLGLSSLSIGGSAIRAPEAAAAPPVKDAPSGAESSAARPKPINHAANHHSANDGSLSSRPLSARRLPKHALCSDSTTAGSASAAVTLCSPTTWVHRVLCASSSRTSSRITIWCRSSGETHSLRLIPFFCALGTREHFAQLRCVVCFCTRSLARFSRARSWPIATHVELYIYNIYIHIYMFALVCAGAGRLTGRRIRSN